MDYSTFTSVLRDWASSRLALVMIVGIITLAASTLAFERISYATLNAIYLGSYVAGCLLTRIPVRVMSSMAFRIFMLTSSLKLLGRCLAWMGREYFYPVKAKTLCVLLACCVTLYYFKLKSE